MRVVILANGEAPSPGLAQTAVARHDLLIATDGAAHKASSLGLTPDWICGDFDSADLAAARNEFPNAEFIHLPDQNEADLEKTLRLAIERGATQVTILGAGGGRVDHTLTAVALVLRYHRNFELVLVHDGSEIRALSGSDGKPGVLRIDTIPSDTISLIAFSQINCVSLRGVKWPLRMERLPVGTHGVSNVASGESVELEVTEGEVLFCRLTTR